MNGSPAPVARLSRSRTATATPPRSTRSTSTFPPAAWSASSARTASASPACSRSSPARAASSTARSRCWAATWRTRAPRRGLPAHRLHAAGARAATSTRRCRCSRTSTSSAACSATRAQSARMAHRRAAREHRPRAVRRPAAGKLSGGMKQKLGLCCALIHDPDLLILDEPTTGVDPLSRRQFWELIARIRARRPGMSVLVATAYMDEAERFDWLVAMDAGRVLAAGDAGGAQGPHRRRLAGGGVRRAAARTSGAGAPRARDPAAPAARRRCRHRGRRPDPALRRLHRGRPRELPHRARRDLRLPRLQRLRQDHHHEDADRPAAAERGEGVAVRPRRGRRTTSRRARASATCRSRSRSTPNSRCARTSSCTRACSTCRRASSRARVDEMVQRFGLAHAAQTLPQALPLGVRQRLSLAVAVIHGPEMLILDEPTSGVDPVARDSFWQLLIDLSRRDGVTIFISTHFMNEAQRCDRISLMHAGRVLASGAPRRSSRRAARARWRRPSSPAWRRRKRASGTGAAAEAPPAAPLPATRPAPGRVQPAALRELRAARGAGAAARSDPARVRAARLRAADDRPRLRHLHRRREPGLRRARPRRHAGEPRLPAQPVRLALLHRAPADPGLRRTRPAHARGRAEPRDRNPGRLRPRPAARPRHRNRRLDRRRHAAARRNRCGLRPGHARRVPRRARAPRPTGRRLRRNPRRSKCASATTRTCAASTRWCPRRSRCC